MKKWQPLLLPKVANILIELGENIKLARLRRKLSAEQVSERAGIGRTTLWAIEKGTGLSLNISEKDNALDFDLALSVATCFRVEKTKAEKIIKTIKGVVSKWDKVAEKYRISRTERELMANAFRY